MKPILFNTEMVRAILEGRKTVTRRVINMDIVNKCDIEKDCTLLDYQDANGDFINTVKLCRYKADDVLYVRETWHNYIKRVGEGEQCHLEEFYGYKASIANSEDANEKWKPSIHMPKEAARLFLRVKSVKVERLQDMTQEDAIKEGITVAECAKTSGFYERDEFIELWNSTIKKDQLKHYGWESNPYVWVIEFEQISKEAAVQEE